MTTLNLLAIPLFMGIGMQELIFIGLLVLLIFGGKKIPELMKGLGKGVRSFKEGVNGIDDETEGEPSNKTEIKKETVKEAEDKA